MPIHSAFAAGPLPSATVGMVHEPDIPVYEPLLRLSYVACPIGSDITTDKIVILRMHSRGGECRRKDLSQFNRD